MMNENSPETIDLRDAQIRHLASAFHDDWRKTRLQDDGTYEPRIKTTIDEQWSAINGTDQVDIANTNYSDLPTDWQAENKAAAEVVIDILNEKDQLPDLDDFELIDQIGQRIHAAWLKRNEWAKGGELDLPFFELADEEKAKDLNQLKLGIALKQKTQVY
jgi:hypothetical protein